MAVHNTTPTDMAAATARTRQHVHCPYCLVGGVWVVAARDTAGNLSMDMAPRTCDDCGRPFRLGYEVRFIGVRLDG